MPPAGRAGFSLHPCIAPGAASFRDVAARADGAAMGLGGCDPDRRRRTRRGLDHAARAQVGVQIDHADRRGAVRIVQRRIGMGAQVW